MSIYKWIDGDVPSELPVKQVYGIVFSEDGRILLKKDGEHYSLAGGKPETFDKNMEDTLKREFLEEVNISISNAVMVGYQLVDEQNGIPLYAQVRMTAKIARIGDRQPDPDSGKTYERLLVPPKRAAELLNWGDVGQVQILSAVKIARAFLGLHSFSEMEQSV